MISRIRSAGCPRGSALPSAERAVVAREGGTWSTFLGVDVRAAIGAHRADLRSDAKSPTDPRHPPAPAPGAPCRPDSEDARSGSREPPRTDRRPSGDPLRDATGYS